VAYVSAESGRKEVYVRRFPHRFRSRRGFMTARVTAGDEIAVSRIERLFDDRRYPLSPRHREYAVLPGDTGFVFIRTSDLGRLFVRFGWVAGLDSLLQGTSLAPAAALSGAHSILRRADRHPDSRKPDR
jgi:hypothetical protein